MKTETPITHALSIRQPWAWLIVNGHKDVENRTWNTHFRGRCYVHASQGMTRAEYQEARRFAAVHGVTVPSFEDLDRGGIVGEMTITDCRRNHPSLWYTGDMGFTVEDAKPLPFRSCAGRLGFFEVGGKGA